MTLGKTENSDDLDAQAKAIAQFPGRRARSLRFTGGAPRSASVIGDGSRALFLRSDGPEDLVTSLWMSVIGRDGSHREVLLADPRELLADADNEDVPAEEKARRERAREGGQGIVSYSADSMGRRVAFTINGQLFVSEIDEDGDGARTRQIAIGGQGSDGCSDGQTGVADYGDSDIRNDGNHATDAADCGNDDDTVASDSKGSPASSKWLPVLNPRISPDGRHIAYTTGARLVMVDIADWGDSGFDDATVNEAVTGTDFAAENNGDNSVAEAGREGAQFAAMALNQDADDADSAVVNDSGSAMISNARNHAHPHTCAADTQESHQGADVSDANTSGDRFSTVWSVGNDPNGTLKIGLAEFVAGEEMDRYDGFWWAPDSRGLLFEMYDSSPEPMWYISDPAHPDKPAAGRRYARALTKNAVTRLMLAHLEFDDGRDEHYAGCDVQNVSWDREAYEYVAVVSWKAGHEPLVLVQNRRQTCDQVLEVQPDGRTRVLEEHANDQWIDLVLGTPAFTPDGRLVCALNDMDTDTNRLTVDGKPFTPVDWQVREVLDVGDENVLAVVQRTPHEVADAGGSAAGASASAGAVKTGASSSTSTGTAGTVAAINAAKTASASEAEAVLRGADSRAGVGIGRESMEIASERGSLPAVPAAWRGDEALHDARSYDVVAIDFDGNITPVTARPGVWSASRAGDGIVVSGHDMAHPGSVMVHGLEDSVAAPAAGNGEADMAHVDGSAVADGLNDEFAGNESVAQTKPVGTDNVLTNDSGYVTEAPVASHAETPGFTPNTVFVRIGEHRMFTAITRPSASSKFAGAAKLPVLMKPYGGPGFQQVTFSQANYWEAQWWADQGFIVVTADNRGTTGRGPKWDREMFEDMKFVSLDDQVEAVHALPQVAPEADLDRVTMIGWSFGGFLSALVAIDAPDVFRAACAGAPPTEWTLYDTHYTERYLGLDPAVYERNSIVADAPKLRRPLMLIHGFADDNVSIANSLRLSKALMEAGRPHTYLPLTGITHMTNDPKVAENLLTLQRDFLYDALGIEG
ncbi:alpha/beta fold hydrolase [Bifidobacterium sp. ESL0704]|uniref:S9 family peptidase n=1 Tax=Bifidobacterium sp. ESL0704 TaxID=2983219 RepID=UPI0023F8E3E2|nr:alpha/beta fold hydrolase [Bifidobacterium sp. ESL0704]WEV52921.1 alpha/beta fold hydrolase [Bifidobacterium sp. ESL0704]